MNMKDKLLESSCIEDIILWCELKYKEDPGFENLGKKASVIPVGYYGYSYFYKVSGEFYVYIGWGKLGFKTSENREHYKYIPEYETTKNTI